MKGEEKRGPFPQSIGWLPIAIAVAAATVVAAGAVAPQFSNRIVGVQQGVPGGGSQATASVGVPGASLPPGATQPPGEVGPGVTPRPGATPGTPSGPIDCAHGRNGGKTDIGVSATQIAIATTDVTTGVGKDFLGQAAQGMQAAINEEATTGGLICGRSINLLAPVNDGWDGPTGQRAIEGFIGQNNVFALVAEPDSEGLSAAIQSGDISRAQIPVVGTDGMLADQYTNEWVWPVAASTVSNMHIVVKYALDQGWAKSAKDFAIVFDQKYKFGAEGARAFAEEVQRLSPEHGSVPGYQGWSGGCQQQFCGVSSDENDFTTEKNEFQPSKVVVMLLEPTPAETWWKDWNHNTSWFQHLLGGEPLFDYNFGSGCGQDCNGMMVWTGYRPDIQPFDAQKAVYTFAHSLSAVCPKCDTQNEFTEGAYLGTKLFIEACRRLAAKNLPLTRQNLHDELDGETFDLGLTAAALDFGSSHPRIANAAMAAYSDNASGSFNGWTYDSTDFIPDPHPGKDF